ncbi:ABC transporter permease subunit [Catenuloplanes indicus]|uniref:Peptide/nickel transport system permease protein n=1 Tax=Catenuloplanes indicus TaxID=137267 RepID=A0AAE3VVL4_9ACTN|nr:ABC transporter permease subunit [Catenuloplanes indicus]MDQ0364139.1 peptide/nickel transport system permease protein [Catenuloplanes indicus]
MTHDPGRPAARPGRPVLADAVRPWRDGAGATLRRAAAALIRPDAVITGLSRTSAVAAVVALVGLLPWLSGRDPALTVLRGRAAEREATPEALAAVRAQLGLDAGPLPLLGGWLSGVLRGDFGTSWVSGRPVLPGLLAAAGVSLTLMAFAVIVAIVVATALTAPALRAAVRGRPRTSGGAVAAALTALPEFLLASVLLIVGAVWLRAFPPYGWDGPHSAVLPALALGVPAGGLIGMLCADAVSRAAHEPWLTTWATAGAGRARTGAALLRRALPSLVPQAGLVVIGLTGGAVAVERVFAIPGLGRVTLGAAQTQDLPVLQGGVLILLLLGVAAGIAAAVARRRMLGAPVRTGSLPGFDHQTVPRRGLWITAAAAVLVLATVTVAGLLRDPYAANRGRLAAPSWALPLGADASGRDLLARLGHGAAATIGTALLLCAACLVIGLLAGLLPRVATGPIEITNAAPPVLSGLLVAAAAGPSTGAAAAAVLAVGWAPLAAHTAALLAEARAQPYVRILPVLGVGPVRVLALHIVPGLLGPLVRHAVARIPGIALALAALGFLGLGPQPPVPDWGLVLSEGLPYVERAPWTVFGPCLSLVALSVLAVVTSALRRRPAV